VARQPTPCFATECEADQPMRVGEACRGSGVCVDGHRPVSAGSEAFLELLRCLREAEARGDQVVGRPDAAQQRFLGPPPSMHRKDIIQGVDEPVSHSSLPE
jgi:hypothetical protein